jgi:hypothetical protein
MKPEHVMAAAFVLLLVAAIVSAFLPGGDAERTAFLGIAAVVTGWLYFQGTSE